MNIPKCPVCHKNITDDILRISEECWDYESNKAHYVTNLDCTNCNTTITIIKKETIDYTIAPTHSINKEALLNKYHELLAETDRLRTVLNQIKQHEMFHQKPT